MVKFLAIFDHLQTTTHEPINPAKDSTALRYTMCVHSATQRSFPRLRDGGCFRPRASINAKVPKLTPNSQITIYEKDTAFSP